MKNILVIGSARSGTHALGSSLAAEKKFLYMGEICCQDGTTNPNSDIEKFLNITTPCVAQLVQLSSKIAISGRVAEIKAQSEIILLRRRNKLHQFASWMYFHKSGGVLKDWHNHQADHMHINQQGILATQQDIDQFLLEQMIDDFFCPDQVTYYEDLDFEQSTVKKNQYAWELPLIFSNLDFVESQLSNWKYYQAPKIYG
jgi:hypothetical protein